MLSSVTSARVLRSARPGSFQRGWCRSGAPVTTSEPLTQVVLHLNHIRVWGSAQAHPIAHLLCPGNVTATQLGSSRGVPHQPASRLSLLTASVTDTQAHRGSAPLGPWWHSIDAGPGGSVVDPSELSKVLSGAGLELPSQPWAPALLTRIADKMPGRTPSVSFRIRPLPAVTLV